MTSTLYKYIFAAVLTVYLHNYIVTAEPPTSNNAAKRPSNRFLSHLFKKYGSHGTITFEGFEHLMHNLGIGDLYFSEKHTLDHHRPNGYKVPDVIYDDELAQSEQRAPDTAAAHAAEHDHSLIQLINKYDSDKQEDIFRTMHDPTHRHPRHRDNGVPKNTCLSPISLIQMYVPDMLNNSKTHPIYRSSAAESETHQHDDNEFSVSNIQISPSAFMSMCPALLVQIEQGSCGERQIPLRQATDEPAIEEITSYAWIAASVSILIISLCGLIGIAMVPLTRFSGYHEFLRFMIAIAIGTLVGDALMHLLPHALIPHEHSDSSVEAHSHEYEHTKHHESEADAVWLCGCAFMTALMMYFIEAFLPLIAGGGSHGHSHGGHAPPISNKVKAEAPHNPECQQQNENPASNCGSCEDLENDIENPKKNIEENVMVKDTKVRPLGALSPVAFMVIIGDGLHNLTDGMAIGAAFGVDPVTGMATALAVLCHELPHELGDFALLLQTGVSLRRAFVFNFISSVLSFIGMVVGLVIVNANSAFVRWIYAGTAGTFLYIAFADLVPELGRSEQSIKMTLIQSLGILIGGLIMLLIGLYEDNLKSLFD